MEKTLSIITPAYNAGKVIAGAVEAMLPQLNDATEWIIVDDGSKDDTAAVLDGLIQANPNVKVVHSANKGAGHARNLGMDTARGEWVSFLDADDLYVEGSVARILAYLSREPLEETEIIYTPRLQSSLEDTSNPDITLPEDSIVDDMPNLEFWTSIYRRDFLNAKHVRFYEYREQDIETAFRYIAFAQCAHLKTEKDLVFYLQRNNPDSNTHTWNHATLFYVKAMVYGDLVMRFHGGGAPSVRMLERVFFECLLKYVKYGKWRGDELKTKRLHALRNLARSVNRLGVSPSLRPQAILARVLV